MIYAVQARWMKLNWLEKINWQEISAIIFYQFRTITPANPKNENTIEKLATMSWREEIKAARIQWTRHWPSDFLREVAATTSSPENVWVSMKLPAREKRTYSRLWKIFLFSLTFRRDSTLERNFFETLKSFACEVEKSLPRDKDHLPTSAPHSVAPAPKSIKDLQICLKQLRACLRN